MSSLDSLPILKGEVAKQFLRDLDEFELSAEQKAIYQEAIKRYGKKCHAQRCANMSEPERLADEHWAWLGSLLEKVYKDAFIHGYKHGEEESEVNE